MNKDSGKVNIHGKEYQTVAYRVGKFREIHQFDLSIVTEIIHRDEDCVVMKATISNLEGKVLATGHSEEQRASSTINRTSALENAETSAIGRALAALGMGGTEFASADEVANAISQQNDTTRAGSGAMHRVAPSRRNIIVDTATQVKDALKEERDFDAFALCESLTDADEKVYLWSFFDSKQRSRIKKQAEATKETVSNA